MLTPHPDKAWMTYTCGCLFQYKEAARAVEAEVSVGVWTVVEMRPNRCCYKLFNRVDVGSSGSSEAFGCAAAGVC